MAITFLRAANRAAARSALVGFLLVPGTYAQSPLTEPPAFEVASIRQHAGPITVSGVDISGSRVTASALTVSDLISYAFSLKGYQLTGLTDWMQSDRYDIIARAGSPGSPTNEQVRRMMQTLLAERFRLKVHGETREVPVYALVVGKNGSRLKENPAGSGVVRFNRKGRDVELVFNGTPIDRLVSQLPRMPGIDRPVVDKTGLTGKYDFNLTLTDFQLSLNNVEQRGIPAADSDGASVFTALQDQLGLRLESQKAPVEFVAIDTVDRPSEN